MPFLVVLLLGALVPVGARADRELSRRSSWNASGTRIRTDVVIERDDGRVETVRVPGGKVGDVAMLQLALGPGGVVVGGVGAPMAGFVRSRATSGVPLHWARSCVYIDPDAAGVSDLPGELELQVLAGALAEWESRTRGCGYLRFELQDPRPHEVGYDGHNVIKYRETACDECGSWCKPARGDDEAECYEAAAAAITTVFFIDKEGASNDGTIVDSDIEVNAVNFAVSFGGTTTGGGSPSDLSNTMTHELGHVIGLDHTCWDGVGPSPIDDAGAPVPSCFPASALSQEIRDATMYNFQGPNEVKKATLEQDDIDGFCGIYPLAADPHDCSRAVDLDDGWCEIAGPSPARRGRASPALPGRAVAALALAALATVTALRRRRRPPPLRH